MSKIVLEDFNEGNGYYKINLAYLNKEQVEEIEALVSKWNPTDENIKACIGMCLTDANEQRFNDYNTNLKECLTWLENQVEHKKFRDSIQVGDEVTRNRDGVIVNLSQLKRVAKKSEQKLPIEKLPEEMKTIGESLGFTTQEECDEYNQMVSNLIMSDDNKSEQKPAWSNKEKLMLNDIIEATERSNIFMEDYQRELIDWLKSLKERYFWKPKTWEIQILESVIEKGENPKIYSATLHSILEQLKKLKGE